MAKTFTVFGVDIDTPSLSQTLSKLINLGAERGGARQVCFVNADCLNQAWGDYAYKRVLDQAALVLPDGTGVRMAARRLGAPAPENVNGTDLFPLLCEASARPGGPTIYLLGGAPGVAERCAKASRARWPGVRIVGAEHGYFRPEEEYAAIDRINAASPDILLVAMGAPRQDLWIARNAARLNVGAAVGVGGLLDFYAGDIPRAPGWMRQTGTEWIWRLAMEPRRLARRYLIGNPLFLLRLRRYAKETAPARVHTVGPARRRQRIQRLRRVLDAAVSGAALLALSPLIGAAALAVRLDSKGPIFFSQTRVGGGGRRFRMFKLRTMHTDAEARKAALTAQNEMNGGVIFKMRDDPRITRVGRFLRKYSIDELPQLWNIFKGDMALVGPRPPLPSETAQYHPADRERLMGRQGLTGLWQIGGRSSLPFERQVRLDVEMNARASLAQDLSILMRTPLAVVKGSGAW